MHDVHEKYMKRAIALARRGVGRTSPNPAVGCVIVKNGEIVGEGWHKKAGTPHAEVHALSMAGPAAIDSDVYVTLEPCTHFGKTPPCADALIAAGVKRVFAAMVDPNPMVSGKGVEKLVVAGIKVDIGLLERESRLFNEPFIKHATTGMPFVIYKSAMTLDGNTATATGDSRWITNEKSRRLVHRLRGAADAIMVGAGTVRADDPRLTCRIPGGKDPVRVIVDSRLTLPIQSQVFHQGSPARTIVAALEDTGLKAGMLREAGVEVLACSGLEGGVDLRDLFIRLGAAGIQSVLLEGGGTLAGEAFRRGLIDKVCLFYAPKMIGGEGPGLFAGCGIEVMADAIRLRGLKIRRIEDDILIEGYPEGSCLPD